MSWQLYVQSAEALLEARKIPSSQEIISLIKRINPTSLQLSETDRERGYRTKNGLQNLLLEHYGQAFHLAPHPYSPDIVLIKHNALPSVNACHANLDALSAKALDSVGNLGPATVNVPGKTAVKTKLKQQTAVCAPKELLRNAEVLLEHYEYPQAEEMLASLRITDAKDLPTLLKAAGMLVEEMGAYGRAIEILLAQPRQVLKDKTVQQLLAITYYGAGMIPEARALFDALTPADLGKNALCAYADISFKDGNLAQAYHLVKRSEEREGFVTHHAGLRKEIEAAMLQEAEPLYLQAEGAFARSDIEQAECLLHKALSLYPNFQKARRLAGEIEAGKAAADLKMLWARFATSEAIAERIDLLAQLLERDKGNGEQIRDLMDRERSRQKREQVEARLDTIRAAAERREWGECFESLLWLSREGDEVSSRQACQLAPCLSLLYQNKKLRRLPDQEAKELWLRFVRLEELLQQGREEECWGLVQDLKPYFHSYPRFKEAHDQVLDVEQDKAREYIEGLQVQLEEFEELEEEARTASLAEARKLVAQIRRRAAVLPVEEGAEYKGDAEAVLNRLEPETYEEGSILDYRAALLLGNSAKAAQLRECHGHMWFEETIKLVEDEVAKKFVIAAEPITLVVSPELAVDLSIETAPTEWEFLCSSERHIVFREDEHTLVVIHPGRMSATKYSSPNFKDLSIMDMLPDKDLFLFVNMENKLTLWRAVLSETECRFTGVFEINEHFSYGENANLELFLSSSKDNACYALIQDVKNTRFVKQHLGLASYVEKTFVVTGESVAAYRLSYQPDKFVLATDSSTTVLESNLAPEKRCSRMGSRHSLQSLGIDITRGQIYAGNGGEVNVLNAKLYAVKQYLKAESTAHLEVPKHAHICVDKHTVLFDIKGRGIFYNMETNKFSQKFAKRRLLHTGTPSRWYYWEFGAEQPAIFLKDITEEVDSLLEWQVLLPPDADESAAMEFVQRLENPDFFSIVKSVEPAAGT